MRARRVPLTIQSAPYPYPIKSPPRGISASVMSSFGTAGVFASSAQAADASERIKINEASIRTRMSESEAPDRRWWTLGAVCVATFMLLLDITIVNVALPDIARDLRSTFSDLGQTIADNFGVAPLSHGTSFLEAIRA